MSIGEAEFRRKLTELGERIDAKIAELRQQGVLHGATPQHARRSLAGRIAPSLPAC